MEELMLVRIDSDYCDYLRKYDSRVPYNYERKKLKSINNDEENPVNMSHRLSKSKTKVKNKEQRQCC